MGQELSVPKRSATGAPLQSDAWNTPSNSELNMGCGVAQVSANAAESFAAEN
jgi:hypothetical protein